MRMSPGKFERVGAKPFRYDPAILPLYDGYAPGAENTEVCEEGGKNVLAAMAVRGATHQPAGGVEQVTAVVSRIHRRNWR